MPYGNASTSRPEGPQLRTTSHGCLSVRERKRGLEMSVSRTPQQEAEENVILEQAAQIQTARKAEQAQIQAQRKAAAPPPPPGMLRLLQPCSLQVCMHHLGHSGHRSLPAKSAYSHNAQKATRYFPFSSLAIASSSFKFCRVQESLSGQGAQERYAEADVVCTSHQ